MKMMTTSSSKPGHSGRLPGLAAVAMAIAMAILLAACNAGSSQSAGIDRGGVTSGPVTGYGSLWVNGSRYLTNSALIIANGAVVNESDLAIGQVVVLTSTGSGANLSAERVEYISNVVGPVQSIDRMAGEFTSLGQTVRVNADTNFAATIMPADLAGLAVDDIVEVSGLVAADGSIVATRINPATAPFRLTGEVDTVGAMQFTIGSQVIDISSAVVPGSIGVGDEVRVTATGLGAADELIASEVVLLERAMTDDGDDGDIEGLINDFSSATDFHLAGFAVTTTGATQYSGGSAADLGNNIRIEAEGQFDAAGTLLAEKIEFRLEGDALVEATVDSIDVPGNLVTVFGVIVEVTPLTAFEDKRDEMRPFDIANLVPGDFVKIAGSWDGANLIATRLERLEGEDSYKLKGPVTSVGSPFFGLLGVNVQTDAGSTVFEVNEMPATAMEFFDGLAICFPSAGGCEAEATWDAMGSLVIAKEVDLE